MSSITDLGVGSESLLDGDFNLGFFGEVEAEKLIRGDSLSALIELYEGIPLFNDEPWLKFAYKTRILYVAKKPIRYHLSWNDIFDVSAVYGDRPLVINDRYYKIRLLKGANENPAPWEHTHEGAYYDPPVTHGSEWNDLMYPIHEEVPASQSRDNYEAEEFIYEGEGAELSRLVYTRKVITEGEEKYLSNYIDEQTMYKIKNSAWEPYEDVEINVADYFGRNTWCQETWTWTKPEDEYKVQRGCDAIDYTTIRRGWDRNDSYGWRPVLEMITKEEFDAMVIPVDDDSTEE